MSGVTRGRWLSDAGRGKKNLNILCTRIQNYCVRFSDCQRFSSGAVSPGKCKFVCEVIFYVCNFNFAFRPDM